MKTLRDYVRRLAEAAIAGEQAVEGGLALLRNSQRGRVVYVLYDPKVLSQVAQEPGFWSGRYSRPLDDIIHGFMEVLPHSGDCNDAMEVQQSAAVKGYGPLLYDMVMSDSDGGLIPHRISTSDAAKKLWQFYSSKRKDVEKNPLDDEDNPKTPETGDDCEMVKDPDEVLNFSYDGPGQSGPKSQLLQRHQEVSKQFAEHGIGEKALGNIVAQMGQMLFDKKYGR